MAVEYKRLGACTVAADTDTALYTVPTGKTAVVNLINICNKGGSSATFRVAWVDGAPGDVADEDYLAYGTSIDANKSVALQLGLTMSSTHTLLVRSSSTNITFLACGLER